jgi:hypothetical protein
MPVTKIMRIAATAVAAFAFATCAAADEMPMPKMFQGMQGEKGQWRMEMLEGGGRAGKGMTMTVCTDNLMNQGAAGRNKPGAAPGCTHKLLKDSADEAVIETECSGRKSTMTMKREGKSMLMTQERAGPDGPQSMKIRATHLGPCREGQGSMTFDKNSEQCRKMREHAAQLDPARQCARQADREACEKRIREAAEKLSAMCN